MPKTVRKLKKELGLLDVYAIAMGTTLSSGFFLLPGLAFAEAGTAMVTSYIVAALLVVPALLSMVELSTAMPRAGGAYYFLDRAMGPLIGTIGGMGTWLVLVLKSAFGLIGLGAYTGLFFPTLPLVPIAVAMAVAFGLVNLLGAKKTGLFQVILVLGLLLILTGFLGFGVFDLQVGVLTQMLDAETTSIFATAGLVYISYAGLTKVTSVAEEVADPERNIPLGMLLALGTAAVFYVLGTWIMVSVIPAEQLSGDLTPVATAADLMFGPVGAVVLTVAAILGFLAAANAGIMSAARYPLAMSRDRLVPGILGRVSGSGTPVAGLLLTVVLVIVVLIGFDPMKIAKLAGAFQLLIFALLCLAVVVMRESRIPSYDPGFKTPLYPWMQYAGIVSSLWIITLMGALSILFSAALLVIGVAWYRYYGSARVERGGAILHWFDRLGERRYEGLDRELRGILKEKGLRAEDPFDEIVARSAVIDAGAGVTFEEVTGQAAAHLSPVVGKSADYIEEAFLEGTRVGATPVTHRVALPHFRIEGLSHPELVLVRSRTGIHVEANDPVLDIVEIQDVSAIFFLVSAEDDPGQHLRLLAQIAGRVDDPGFQDEWVDAADESEIKEVILRDERFMTLRIDSQRPTGRFAGKTLRDLSLPEGALVAIIRRAGDMIVPRGDTQLLEGDRLTIIGEPDALETIRREYVMGRPNR